MIILVPCGNKGQQYKMMNVDMGHIILIVMLHPFDTDVFHDIS